MSAKKMSTVIRKGQIIQAALHTIETDGLKGLTVGKIASYTGVVPSAIYRHFKNKKQIVEAVLNMVGMRLVNNLNRAGSTGRSSVESLKAILFSQIEAMEELSFVFLRMLMSEESSFGGIGCKERVNSIFKELLDAVEQIIIQGQDAGEIRQGLSSSSMAMMFLGLYQSPSFLYLLDQEGVDLAGQAKESWELFQTAIAAHA